MELATTPLALVIATRDGWEPTAALPLVLEFLGAPATEIAVM